MSKCGEHICSKFYKKAAAQRAAPKKVDPPTTTFIPALEEVELAAEEDDLEELAAVVARSLAEPVVALSAVGLAPVLVLSVLSSLARDRPVSVAALAMWV